MSQQLKGLRLQENDIIYHKTKPLNKLFDYCIMSDAYNETKHFKWIKRHVYRLIQEYLSIYVLI